MRPKSLVYLNFKKSKKQLIFHHKKCFVKNNEIFCFRSTSQRIYVNVYKSNTFFKICLIVFQNSEIK